MSLATRCPECRTTFKVVPDQLRVSDGWVRCGRCSRVFDANDHMVSALRPEPEPASPDEDLLADDDSPWSAMPAASPSWERLPSLELGGKGGAQRVDPSWSFADFEVAGSKPLAPAAFDFDTFTPSASSASPAPEGNDAAPHDRDAPSDEEHMPFAVRTPSESSQAAARHDRSDAHGADESDFSFLGASVDPAMERRRRLWRRVALVVLALAAVLVLVAQVIAQSHDAIVAREPALRPAVLAWCHLAGCTVSPLRKIDDIAIDGSAFVRQKGGDGYLLSFTLRNRSGLPLAMPAIELSLLDTRERPVLRRVLHPADFGAPLVLSARGEHSAALPLVLAPSQAEALQPLIVGYHLDPFYP